MGLRVHRLLDLRVGSEYEYYFFFESGNGTLISHAHEQALIMSTVAWRALTSSLLMRPVI